MLNRMNSVEGSKVVTRRIEKYDGQTISIGGDAIFELGNYLVTLREMSDLTA